MSNTSTRRPQSLRSRVAAVLALVGIAFLSGGLTMTAASAVEPQVQGGGEGQDTCDKLGYTKVDQASGSVSEDFGTLEWSGDTLTYDILEGYTVGICIKAGTEITQEVVTGAAAGSFTVDKEISHIGYTLIETPPTTTPPTTTPPTTTPPTTTPPTTTPPTTTPPTTTPPTTTPPTTTPPTSTPPTTTPSEGETTPSEGETTPPVTTPADTTPPGAALPTAVDAGLTGATASSSSLVATLGKSLMGAGLVLLLAAGWIGLGRQTRGAHQV